jgi:glycosyltransferase involved in cell wall biosynthesis
MTVRRLPYVGAASLNRVINFPFPANPVWFYSILRAAAECRADCILVRDLPLALTALAVGRRLGVPVVYDMAEVYPEFLRDRVEFGRASLLDRLVKSPRAATLVERAVLRRAAVIVVSEESRDRCLRMGVAPDRLVHVGNTPADVDAIDAVRRDPARDDPAFDDFVLLFVGILMWDRGVADVVRALPAIRAAFPKTRLVVAGDGDERVPIERLIGELRLEPCVDLLGWKDHASLPELYAKSDVGLLPFLAGRHVKITLANKLFDYMAAGLPIVASDLPPMRRVIDETNAGVLFTPGDPAALAEATIGLLRDGATRRRLAQNGRRAAAQKYNWREDEKRFLGIFDSVPGRVSAPPQSPRGAATVRSPTSRSGR